MNAMHPLVKHPLVLAFGTLLALSLACGGGGFGPTDSGDHHSGSTSVTGGHNDPKHPSGNAKSGERTRMSGDNDKPLPNVILSGHTKRFGQTVNLYQPVFGYIWSDSLNSPNRQPRTSFEVVPVVRAK